jgi:hypothetical protein
MGMSSMLFMKLIDHIDKTMIQNLLPSNATLGPVILGSDKTHLTNCSGAQECHVVVMSIGNISKSIRGKATAHAFEPLAYIPLGDWKDKKHKGLLQQRCYHQCMDIILKPLKIAAQIGSLMSDPAGNLRLVFTPLASHIADRPEHHLITATSHGVSPVSHAATKEFGNPQRFDPRSAKDILNAIESLNSQVDPMDIQRYQREARTRGLSGVYAPFWRDWFLVHPDALPNPVDYLTPDPLHQWYRFIFDHILHWVSKLLGENELNFRISILQRQIGFRHFTNGCTNFKQVTGNEQQDMGRYLVALINGHPKATYGVVTAIRSLTDFIYLGQYSSHDEDTLKYMEDALCNFHHHKEDILSAGLRCGSTGEFNYFNIPKLEMMQHVTANTRRMGIPAQYTTDITEHKLIEVAKEPFRLTNKHEPAPQMVRALDRSCKIRIFSLYLQWYHNLEPTPQEKSQENNTSQSVICEAAFGSRKQESLTVPNFFLQNDYSQAINNQDTAYHLSKKPHWPRALIDDVAIKYQLSDLRAALGDYIVLGLNDKDRRGIRRSSSNCLLPFSRVHVWYSVRLQTKSPSDPNLIMPPRTVQAMPPTADKPHGWRNTVLFVSSKEDAFSAGIGGMNLSLMFNTTFNLCPYVFLGYSIGQLCLILQPFYPRPRGRPVGINTPSSCLRLPELEPLAYVQYFSYSHPPHSRQSQISTPIVNTALNMYEVHRSNPRTGGIPKGDIIPISSLWQPIQLVPKFNGGEMHIILCQLLL